MYTVSFEYIPMNNYNCIQVQVSMKYSVSPKDWNFDEYEYIERLERQRAICILAIFSISKLIKITRNLRNN